MAFYVYLLAFSCILSGIPVKADEDEEAKAACMTLFDKEKIKEHCCETMNAMAGEQKERACLKDGEDYTCDVAKCMFESKGLLNGDEINEEKIIEKLNEMEKNHEDTKSITASIRDKCLNKKYLDFPPKDACPLIRMQVCMWAHTMTGCQKWKDTDSCKKLAEDSQKCKKAMDSKE